ncbi:MAG: MAPEG family protein [Beijerinckiaceae bacterium]|nr:MAPEG family protein [Beijerinckiaceae bacterium]
MHPINLTALVTLLALLLYMFMMVRVSRARGTSGLKAPSVVGDPTFERHYRVQMNTLESLPVFLVSLWLFSLYWGEYLAALLGVVWIIGRAIYMLNYVEDPKKRGTGFMIQAIALIVLIVGAIVGSISAMLVTGGL